MAQAGPKKSSPTYKSGKMCFGIFYIILVLKKSRHHHSVKSPANSWKFHFRPLENFSTPSAHSISILGILSPPVMSNGVGQWGWSFSPIVTKHLRIV